MSTQTDAYSFLQPSPHAGDLGMLGDYRILGELGKGGMGYVFRAQHTVLERPVALKVMNKKIASTPNSRDRFLQEARAMAAVHHDNVVVIFEVGMNEGTPFMAMEMLRGETLEAVNARKEARDYETVIRYASQIASGLAAAHDKEIVHRDIKPANIWIEEENQRIKILDFGLALAQSPLDEFAGVGSVCGTPGYLTPEQARSDPLDDRSDLYSLGAVLYEMCTGRLPIQRPAIAEQLVALLSHAPKPIRELNPDVPQPLADLIHRLLAKEAVDRPVSASTLVKELRKVAIECDAKSETALSLNKLQESLAEVVSKQETVEEPVEVVKAPVQVTQEAPNLPAFDALAVPAMATAPGMPAAGTPGAGTSGARRIGTPGRPVNRNARRPAAKPAVSPVSPVVWLAAGVGITLGLVGIAVWMIWPSTSDSLVVQPPGTPSTNTSQPSIQQTPADKSQPESQPAVQRNQSQRNQSQGNQTQGGNKKGGGKKRNTKKRKGDTKKPTPNATVERSQPDPNEKNDPEPSDSQPVVRTQPAREPDAMVALKDTEKDKSSPTMDDEKPAMSPADTKKTRAFAISTLDGIGADSTVRKSSAGVGLGKKMNLAVQVKQGEELQHIYLRFDLEGLPTDRKEVRDAIVRLHMLSASEGDDLTLRLHGTDAAAAEKWEEEGPLTIKWNNSFSRGGLADLPVLAEFSGDVSSNGVVTFKGGQLAEFIRKSSGRSVTFVVAGGHEGKLAVLFVAREKDPEKTPTLIVSIPQS